MFVMIGISALVLFWSLYHRMPEMAALDIPSRFSALHRHRNRG